MHNPDLSRTYPRYSVFPFSFLPADDARDVHVHVHVHVHVRRPWVWIGVACGRAGGPLVDLGIVSCLERALDLRQMDACRYDEEAGGTRWTLASGVASGRSAS